MIYAGQMMRARKRKPFGSYDHWHFYELVLRKKQGSATLKELDELDELVNRVPAIREKLLADMLKNDRDSIYRGGLVKWLKQLMKSLQHLAHPLAGRFRSGKSTRQK